MVEVDFSGNYLSAENCKPNDIGFIVNEGSLIDRTKNVKTWKQLTMTIDINQKQFSHSFRSAEGKKFQELYGKDTKLWIGKKVMVTFIPYVDGKEIKQNIELIPVEEEIKLP